MENSIVNKYSLKYLGYEIVKPVENGSVSMDLKSRLTISVAFAFVCLAYYLFCRVVFQVCSKTYKNLPKKEKMFWSLAVVRGTYGLIGSLGSAYARVFDGNLSVNVATSKTELSYMLFLCHLGFFVFEWSAQIYFDLRFKTFSKALHGHHALAFTGYLNATINDEGHFMGLTSFILEMSTPFSCVCYMLIKSNLSDTLLWKANQLLLIHVFHLRSVVEFTMMYEYYKYWDLMKSLSLLTRLNFGIGLFIVGFFLTPYWTYRKTEQFFTKSDWNAADNKNKKE